MGKVVDYKTILFVLLLMMSFQVQTVFSKPSEPYQKESKKVSKKLKEGGWQVFGTNKTIRESLDVHYRLLGESEGNLMPIEGYGKAKDVNVALRKSHRSAAQQYASMRETKVEGVIQTKISNTDGEKSETSFDSNYQSSVEQVVKSLTPTVVFYRTLDDGSVEVRAFFLVDTLK
jgi:hypothetical protein